MRVGMSLIGETHLLTSYCVALYQRPIQTRQSGIWYVDRHHSNIGGHSIKRTMSQYQTHNVVVIFIINMCVVSSSTAVSSYPSRRE